MNYIKTLNGIFNYDDIESNVLDIEDIAHSLSLQCRYGGHVAAMYSVANHSLSMMDAYISKEGLTVETLTIEQINILLQMLLHDATEAYLTDLPRPIKKLMPEYKEVEGRIEEHVYKFFDLGVKYDVVTEYDNRILADEMLEFFGESYVDFEPLGIELAYDRKEQNVKETFIFVFNILNKKKKELENV